MTTPKKRYGSQLAVCGCKVTPCGYCGHDDHTRADCNDATASFGGCHCAICDEPAVKWNLCEAHKRP